MRERRREGSESWLAQDCQNFKSQSPAPLDSPQVWAMGMVDTWSEAWASGRQGPGWSLHKSLLGSQGSHRLTALPRLQGAQPPLQEAPRCQREARDPVPSLPSPTTDGPACPRQGCLTWLEKAAATWEVSGSCGKLAAGERPLSPPPSSRNCPLHIRKDRALERENG